MARISFRVILSSYLLAIMVHSEMHTRPPYNCNLNCLCCTVPSYRKAANFSLPQKLFDLIQLFMHSNKPHLFVIPMSTRLLETWVGHAQSFWKTEGKTSSFLLCFWMHCFSITSNSWHFCTRRKQTMVHWIPNAQPKPVGCRPQQC